MNYDVQKQQLVSLVQSGVTSNTDSKRFIENTEDIITLSKSYDREEEVKEARIMKEKDFIARKFLN